MFEAVRTRSVLPEPDVLVLLDTLVCEAYIGDILGAVMNCDGRLCGRKCGVADSSSESREELHHSVS